MNFQKFFSPSRTTLNSCFGTLQLPLEKTLQLTLREKCPYLEFFRSVSPALDLSTQDSRIIQTFLIQLEYGHFSGLLDARLLIVIMEKT